MSGQHDSLGLPREIENLHGFNGVGGRHQPADGRDEPRNTPQVKEVSREHEGGQVAADDGKLNRRKLTFEDC